MTYQVLYTINKASFASKPMIESQAKMFVERLNNSGIEAQLVEREDRKYRCPKVIFDIQLLEKARKACKEKRNIDGLYTFGDPTDTSEKDTIGKFRLRDGSQKNGYIVDVWKATAERARRIPRDSASPLRHGPRRATSTTPYPLRRRRRKAAASWKTVRTSPHRRG